MTAIGRARPSREAHREHRRENRGAPVSRKLATSAANVTAARLTSTRARLVTFG